MLFRDQHQPGLPDAAGGELGHGPHGVRPAPQSPLQRGPGGLHLDRGRAPRGRAIPLHPHAQVLQAANLNLIQNIKRDIYM